MAGSIGNRYVAVLVGGTIRQYCRPAHRFWSVQICLHLVAFVSGVVLLLYVHLHYNDGLYKHGLYKHVLLICLKRIC